ncbi:MAG: ATP-binding protein [Chloroflexota bacterium]
MAAELQIPIRAEGDIVTARQRAREVARNLGFGVVDQSRIATAVSELTRNVIRYATNGSGELTITALGTVLGEPAGRVGLEAVVSDDGPGIANVNEALGEGFSSGSGLGLGLPGTRRLMDEMVVESEPGRGTTVTVRKWRR